VERRFTRKKKGGRVFPWVHGTVGRCREEEQKEAGENAHREQEGGKKRKNGCSSC